MTLAPYPQPGWYPDPSGNGGRRYWDGLRWGPTAPPPRQPLEINWQWTALIAVLILCPGSCLYFVAASLTSHHKRQSSAQHVEYAAPAPAPPARIGKEVRDGAFAFVVTKVSRSRVAGNPRNKVMHQKAEGEYLNVHLRVTNRSDRPETYLATVQKLRAGDRQYTADEQASIWNHSASVQIQPGKSVDVIASFDVPVGTPAGVIELHEAPMSMGAAVQL
ncbi:MAG TPA: DUF4352 domain-containing protein [Mycobacterium sp.]|nr:DUF4352 domain-containing protein [Mycobacterium sp.]